jgi:hypothetical protein
MEFGIVGLGRMGGNMARRLARKGMNIAIHNRSHEVSQAIAAETGHLAFAGLEELVAALQAPRIVWLMLPAGEATETALNTIAPLLSPGDLVVDGGNAYYKDGERRAAALASRQIDFADAGVSGGIWGLDNGYCIMFGGSDAAAARLKPWMEALAPTAYRWLAAHRSGRLGTLRQDGPQRHRVRHDAGLRRRLRADEEQARIRSRSGQDKRALAPRQRGALVAARPVGGVPCRRCQAGSHPPLRGRLRRGPLDRARSGRAGHTRAGDVAGLDDALRQPGQERLRGEGSGEDAPGIRRSCAEGGVANENRSRRRAALHLRHLWRYRQSCQQQAAAGLVSPRGGGATVGVAQYRRLFPPRLGYRTVADAHARGAGWQDQRQRRGAGIRALRCPLRLSAGRPQRCGFLPGTGRAPDERRRGLLQHGFLSRHQARGIRCGDPQPRGGRTQQAARPQSRGGGKNPSARTSSRRACSISCCTSISTRSRSSVSIISSARRRCRTCWCSASPTP